MPHPEPVPAPDRSASERKSDEPGQSSRKNAPIPDPEDAEIIDADPDLDPDPDPQPLPENGVDEDMASIALDSALLKGAQLDPGRTDGGRTVADWSAMSDAEIMLRVREGDDSGFDLLIHKYHKPIIHFMFRMVHNQAVAEELAQ